MDHDEPSSFGKVMSAKLVSKIFAYSVFQVNRMKAFSLQHRMNLMRQYKIKQHHLNKLLESFHDTHSPEALRKHVKFQKIVIIELL